MIRNDKQRLDWKKYSWQKFEDICFEYMEQKYDSPAYKVEITKRQKDGGRDIIVTEEESEYTIWGECKHHKASVGLSTIGKNVVLAITNQIHKLVFFSVSHVTPNTKYEILRAAKIHNFDVQFLDGSNLDLEILGNKYMLHKYFPEVISLYHPNKDVLSLGFCVDEFPNAHNSYYNTDNSYTKLENGLTFYIHLFIKNYFSKDITDVSVKLVETAECHFYKTQFDIDSIRAYCDTEVTIKGLLLNTQVIVTLPEIVVSYSTKNDSYQYPLHPGELDGKNIWRIPFCGEHNLNFIATKIPDIAMKIKRGYSRIIYIKGASGTGKTRMLEEIETKFTEKNIVSIYIDTQVYSMNQFFRELICKLLCLPYERNQLNSLSYNEFSLLLSELNIYCLDNKSIYNFLWNNKKMESTQIVDFLCQCIVNTPLKVEKYIQIDNIQAMDMLTQQCMTYLCDYMEHEKTYLCIAFALNTSIERVSKHSPLIGYLEQNAIHDEDPYIVSFEMRELGEQDAHFMIQTSLKLDKGYEAEVQRIEQKTGRLPLDILLFCKTLYNNNGFLWNGEYRIIGNAEMFNRELNILSASECSIIELRIRKLTESSFSENFLKLFQLICICENRLPIDVARHFRISVKNLNILKQNLVIKENFDSTLSFYHDNYLRYFRDKETLYSFNVGDWNSLYKLMLKYEPLLGFIAKINQVKCLAFLGKKNEFLSVSENMLKEFCDSGNNQAILSLTQFCLKWMDVYENQDQWLKFSLEKAYVEIECISFIQGIDSLKIIKKEIDNYASNFKIQLIGKFYHQYVNAFTHSSQYIQAIHALDDYSKIKGLDAQNYFLIEDRYCLAYSALGDFINAKEHIKKALVIAHEMNSDFWISTAYSDQAFNYLVNTNCPFKIVKYFRLAAQYYAEKDDKTQYRVIEIEIQLCLADILSKDYQGAEMHINKAIKYCKERAYTYLLIPASNVKAFLLIIKNNVEEALRILFQARFSCEVFGETKYLITIFNTLGIAYSVSGNKKEGSSYFLHAEKVLREMSKPENTANRFAPLIANWILIEYSISTTTILNNEIFDYYHSKKIDMLVRKLRSVNNNYTNLKDYFPFTINNYAFIY